MKQQIPLQIVSFTDKISDPQNPRTMYRTAIRPQAVINADKFVENVANHSGQKAGKIMAVLTALPLAVKDYLEAGNAVQIENFCTIKPRLKVKAVSSPEDCTADTIKSVSVLSFPIGSTKELCRKFKFSMTTLVSAGAISDEEGDTNLEDDEEAGSPAPEQSYKITFVFKDGSEQSQTLPVGDAISYPQNTEGYVWPDSRPSVMPAKDVTVTEVANAWYDPENEPD